MSHYFGTDGFRGEAGRGLCAAHAYRIGRFLGHYGRTLTETRVRVCIGKDTRRSSYMLEAALAAGLTASGAEAYLLHVTTTPGVAYITRTDEVGFDCGVMISASHNPFDDNGIKLIGARGEKLEGECIDALEHYLDTPDPNDQLLPCATGADIGRMVDYRAGNARYRAYLIALCRHSYEGLRIGLDCANGSAWHMAQQIFTALGAQVDLIGHTPDGLNINLGVGSTHPEALQRLVEHNHLDAGFAFDGDADRCLAVDETGKLLTGDHILYILAKEWQRRGLLEGNCVVATVMSNLGLFRALEEEGISHIETAVGDRFVYEEMQKSGYHLGGEQSGHIILRPLSTTGDGMLTALSLLEVMVGQKQPLSRLASSVRLYPQLHQNLKIEQRDAALEHPAVLACLARVRARMGTQGRVILRKSGTEPLLRVMVEAKDPLLCEEAMEEMVACFEETGFLWKEEK